MLPTRMTSRQPHFLTRFIGSVHAVTECGNLYTWRRSVEAATALTTRRCWRCSERSRHESPATSWRASTRQPGLAQRAMRIAASRQDAEQYFLRPIQHYVYAGDTALHVAAAAYAWKLAESLVARGADTRVRNRRGAEPLHYAADGSPDADYWDPVAQSRTIEYLIAAGGDPNALRQEWRRSPASSSSLSFLGRGACAHRARRGPEGHEQERLDAAAPRGAEHRPKRLSYRRREGRTAPPHQLAPRARHTARGPRTPTRGKTVAAAASSDWIRQLLART